MFWLRVEIDESLNQEAIHNLTLKISAPQSRVEVWVVPTDEGVMTAKEALSLLRSQDLAK
nr:hypothetical protein [Polynucleobacter necessarius]